MSSITCCGTPAARSGPVKSFFASCIVDRQPYAPPDGTSGDGTAPGVSTANTSGVHASGL